jgi:hypothetical protein
MSIGGSKHWQWAGAAGRPFDSWPPARHAILIGIVGGALLAGGCATQSGTGAAVGTGIGALAGQIIGGNTTATLVGGAVGAGVGYLIGNERDRERASQARVAEITGGLGGTRWRVVEWSPQEKQHAFESKIVEFRPDGEVVTTTIFPGGASRVDSERYRVVDQTLIVNKPGYMINYRYAIVGDQMTLTAERVRATLRRI